ncbi:unnamed protein product, partial [Cyprideis torosa]
RTEWIDSLFGEPPERIFCGAFQGRPGDVSTENKFVGGPDVTDPTMFSSILGPVQLASSTETLLRNIEGLLRVAADSARQQERQIQLERAELKMELAREREQRESSERQLHEEQRIRVIVQKRLKREKRERQAVLGDLESEKDKRRRLEEALRVTAPDVLRSLQELLNRGSSLPRKDSSTSAPSASSPKSSEETVPDTKGEDGNNNTNNNNSGVIDSSSKVIPPVDVTSPVRSPISQHQQKRTSPGPDDISTPTAKATAVISKHSPPPRTELSPPTPGRDLPAIGEFFPVKETQYPTSNDDFRLREDMTGSSRSGIVGCYCSGRQFPVHEFSICISVTDDGWIEEEEEGNQDDILSVSV